MSILSNLEILQRNKKALLILKECYESESFFKTFREHYPNSVHSCPLCSEFENLDHKCAYCIWSLMPYKQGKICHNWTVLNKVSFYALKNTSSENYYHQLRMEHLEDQLKWVNTQLELIKKENING